MLFKVFCIDIIAVYTKLERFSGEAGVDIIMTL